MRGSGRYVIVILILAGLISLALLFPRRDNNILTAKAISAIASHTVVLDRDGKLWAWANNDSVIQSLAFAQRGRPHCLVSNLLDATSIAADWIGFSAVDKNTSILRWGVHEWSWKDYGHVLTNSTAKESTDAGWTATAAGMDFFIGLKTNNTLWAWGGNEFGQLGIGTHGKGQFIKTPVQIGSDSNWVMIAARIFRATGIKSDGSLWAWGWNVYGELGDGTSTLRDAPVRIGTDNDWKAVFTGNDHTLAIKQDGSLWAWGQNRKGQLGDGTKINKSYPIRVGAGTGWLGAAGGRDHTLAIKRNGTLWAWGLNDQGQLGDGTKTDRLTPVQIGWSRSWRLVAAGEHHSVAAKSDGTVYAWGPLTEPKDGKFYDFWSEQHFLRENLERVGIRYPRKSSVFLKPAPVHTVELQTFW